MEEESESEEKAVASILQIFRAFGSLHQRFRPIAGGPRGNLSRRVRNQRKICLNLSQLHGGNGSSK